MNPIPLSVEEKKLNVIRKRLKDITVYKCRWQFFHESNIEKKFLPNFFNPDDSHLTEDEMKFGNKGYKVRLTHLRLKPTQLSEIIETSYEGRNVISNRMVPEMIEIKNAIMERSKVGGDNIFSGIPVFQSDALRMLDRNPPKHPTFIKNTKYLRPAFFRKKDLEKALDDANEFNRRDIQVTALEDMIRDMKVDSSKWDDDVFISPGNPQPIDYRNLKRVLKFAAKIYLTFL